MLIRNTDWARALLGEMAAYGKYPIDWGKEETMRAALPSYDIGMYEQNMLVYTIMHDPAMMAKARCVQPLSFLFRSTQPLCMLVRGSITVFCWADSLHAS